MSAYRDICLLPALTSRIRGIQYVRFPFRPFTSRCILLQPLTRSIVGLPIGNEPNRPISRNEKEGRSSPVEYSNPGGTSRIPILLPQLPSLDTDSQTGNHMDLALCLALCHLQLSEAIPKIPADVGNQISCCYCCFVLFCPFDSWIVRGTNEFDTNRIHLILIITRKQCAEIWCFASVRLIIG